MAKQLAHTFSGVMDTKVILHRVTYAWPDSTSGEQYSIVPQKV